ncbi:GlsB/YeaQ/YmgE family stress response membrane protein [Dyella sp. C11]|uniref:GlsB/YeaQ/YmgE family stress response membrane protein n=1 Tax=Dyella sp. C11 TaxID=2126991 RepID=UPI000D64C173|nr:GlsB/YeaQ/YmgE family stress response membrane protein [Dyella sp. C11]
MTVEGLLIFLLIGAIAGWLAGLIVQGFGFGLLGNIVIGIIGAFFAGWLLPRLGVHFAVGGPILNSVLHAMIGAVVLLVIVGLIRRV